MARLSVLVPRSSIWCRPFRRVLPALVALAVLAAHPPLALALPDLTGTVDIVVHPPEGEPSQCLVEWEVTLINIGDAQCPGNWWADFWSNYPATCSEHPYKVNPAGGETWDSKITGNIKPGQAKTFQGSTKVPENVLPYHYMLFLDSIFDGCKESNENNNLICDEFWCLADPADLVVSCSVEIDPENSEGVLVTATATNQGMSETNIDTFVDVHMDKASAKCEDHFLKDPSGFGKISSGIPPGGTQTILIPVPLVEAGMHWPVCVVNGNKGVKETTYANNCDFTEQFLMPEIADQPDLLVPQCGIALEGNIPIYQGKLVNEGYSDIETGQQHKLCIFFDKPDKPGLNEVPDVMAGQGVVISYQDPLPVGGEIPFAKSGPPLQNGYYKAWFRADCDSEIFEADEKNNDCSADVIVDLPGPDIFCKEITWVLEEEDDKAQVRYTVNVSNKGSDPSPPFDIDIFFDTAQPPGCFDVAGEEGDYFRFQESLDPDGLAQAEFLWSRKDGIPAGTYTSWVVLDICDELAKYETNTKNNICGPIEVVVEPIIPGNPNLEASTFTCKATTDILYHVKVCNTGSKPVKEKFRVDLFRDREKQPMVGDIGDYFQEVDGLSPGECIEWTPVWESPPDGEYHAYVYVDVESVVVESFEGDNVSGPRICVVCHDCAQCEEGIYLSAPCFCGDQSVQYGFCCGGEWYAVGCPDPVEPVEAVEFEIDATTVEFDTPSFKPDPSCGCRVTDGPHLPAGVLLVLLLSAGVLFATRRRTAKSLQPRARFS